MFAVVSPDQIQLPPGAVVRLAGDWQDYQTLVQQLGDRQLPRIKYRPGEILLMAPLPKHGREADVIAAVVRTLLEALEQDYTAFTPITMEVVEVSGIEPDYCFYIENWAEIAGKDRIDWGIDPAPDLVIEVDVTSYTDINDYLPYRIPEVWLFRQNQLVIYQLQNQVYSLQTNSQYFPNFPVSELVLEALKLAFEQNTNVALRMLRQRLASLL